MKIITVLSMTIIVLTSCYSKLHLHQSGTYTIKERNGSITEFWEVKGKYTILSDTLKKNDKIVINVIKAGGFNRVNKRDTEDVPNSKTIAKD